MDNAEHPPFHLPNPEVHALFEQHSAALARHCAAMEAFIDAAKRATEGDPTEPGDGYS